MWWLILKFIPVGSILSLLFRVVLAILIIGAVGLGMGMIDPAAAQSDAVNQSDLVEEEETIEFSHSPTVNLLSVEYEDGDAIVTMTSSAGGERVIITDSSRTTSGEMERSRFVLEPGENTFRVTLHNPDNPAITVDSDGSIYLDRGPSQAIPWNPDVAHSVGTALLAGVVVILLVVALHLVMTRGNNTANNPIE